MDFDVNQRESFTLRGAILFRDINSTVDLDKINLKVFDHNSLSDGGAQQFSYSAIWTNGMWNVRRLHKKSSGGLL